MKSIALKKTMKMIPTLWMKTIRMSKYKRAKIPIRMRNVINPQQ